MTASATALALLPMISFGNIPGHEMAIGIVGGLVSSKPLTFLLLTLLLLPTIFEPLGPKEVSP